MALTGKLEADVEIKASADKFHDVFGSRPHHVKHATPHNIKGCELHDGEFGKEGSVVFWNYVHDGVPKVAKEIVEKIDDVNLSTTFTVIEGDLLKEYKNFKITVKATPKGTGSVAHWTLEYEKLNKDIPDPHSLVKFLLDVSKDIDAHLTKA
ncbi:MLP-like protein 31 isoform X1 [Jatropha curcas]|uniref:MLP-like protein 31 isoform X1 n=1 Tax=Jatropha curcas TaxID=180498 RepID=UPI0005FB2969|nr:MLP-like protein 31 isoform X1 [Jatropha curcas]